MRGGIAIVLLALAACGPGSGEGLDQNGQPISGGSGSGGGGSLAPPVPGLAPTLASIQTDVFNINCAVSGCHGGAAAQQGLRLDPGFAAGNLINVPSTQLGTATRVIPGNPNDSLIIQKLEGKQPVGERMPQGGPYLPQSTIDVIRQWIQDGAPQ